MLEDKVERAGKSIPEWYVDLLARFVPGSVFLFAYLWPYLSSQIPVLASVGFILIAYFIGLFAEVLSRMFLSPLLRRSLSTLRPGFYTQARDMLSAFERLSESQQDLLKKMMAESALFRASVILCIPLLIYPAPSSLSICYYHAVVGVVALLFLLCHIHCQIHLKHRVDVFLSTLPLEPNE
jgi:hypothetical protein